MEGIIIGLGVLILGGIGTLLYYNITSKKSPDSENLKNELTKLTADLRNEASSNVKLEAKNETLQHQCNDLQRKISQFEEAKERKEKEFEKLVGDLNKANETLEDEKKRIRREDEDRLQQQEEERNRVWNDHENLVLATLRDICQKPKIGFQFFENTNLPADFTGELKPDFLIEFLGQYIIFDAKKSKDPKNYIRTQVKDTAKKLKENTQIYSIVFFVMPQNEIEELKETSFFEAGYSFYVVPQYALEPLLANFKKISEYEKIQEMDPQDRENIVNLIAGYDRHISFQNAANILLAKESIDLMQSKERNLNSELLQEINIKKQHIRPLSLRPTDIKKLENLDRQHSEIESMIKPTPDVAKKDLDNAKNSLFSE